MADAPDQEKTVARGEAVRSGHDADASAAEYHFLKTGLADRYRLERPLGTGGMGLVYLAHDLKHRRDVALKVLRRELSAALGIARFRREIEIAGRLNHPGIVPLFDSGEVEELLFYVMPVIEGESLRAKLTREERLSLDEALSITGQVASALAYAHSQHVIHRDVKPENILIRQDHALLTDFGIALPAAGNRRLTSSGFWCGTRGYMSPEALMAQETIDARSDIYSLGCVLAEMLSGELPSHESDVLGSGGERAFGRLTETVPPYVIEALRRALAPRRDDRFSSMVEFAEALTARAGERRRPCVAVLPFVNLSGDPESDYFADGVTEDVITQLSKIAGLKVISRTSIMRFAKSARDLRAIGRTLRTDAVVDGSVRRAGNRVRVSTQLIDIDSETHLWAESYDRELIDVFVTSLCVSPALFERCSRMTSVNESKRGRQRT